MEYLNILVGWIFQAGVWIVSWNVIVYTGAGKAP